MNNAVLIDKCVLKKVIDNLGYYQSLTEGLADEGEKLQYLINHLEKLITDD